MKKQILTFLIVMLPFILFAQQETYRDVVELKNGAVIKGTIIEHIPNQQIKIEVADDIVFVYQMDEISKLRKEIITKDNQNNNRDKGYVGISFGLSIPSGGNVPDGFTLSLVDFGYRFYANIGMAGKWFGSAYVKNTTSLFSGGLMIGILGLFPITERTEFTGRILMGFEKGELEYITRQGNTKRDDYVGLAYDLGIGMKFNTKGKVAFLANFDYVKMKYYNSINMTFGVAYRL